MLATLVDKEIIDQSKQFISYEDVDTKIGKSIQEFEVFLAKIEK